MEFRDLHTQYKRLKRDIDQAISNVICSANFIGGEFVCRLEEELADYTGTKHCVTCANGTDAISLALKAWEVGPNDAIFVPDFSFFSTAECPAVEGATLIFVDVDTSSFNIDPCRLEEAILYVKKNTTLCPRAIIAVDLFGQPADYYSLRKICDKYDLLLLEDGAQGFGGSIDQKKACSFGDISTTSFFPAKPLGCYGDGGAVFTDNDEWAEIIRSLAVHGKGKDKYDNIRIGMNSRLDAVQAAILSVKLKAFQEYELKAVNQIAMWYKQYMPENRIVLPAIKEGFYSSWAQYTIQLSGDADRNLIRELMSKNGIPTNIYYLKSLHSQKAFIKDKDSIDDTMMSFCENTEKLCDRVLSLPIHPYMEETDVEKISDCLRRII